MPTPLPHLPRQREPDARPVRSPGPRDWFTGHFELVEVSGADASAGVRVEFSPGARSAWHALPLGLVVHMLEGLARVHRDGRAVVEVTPGGTVWFAPGDRDWRGPAREAPAVQLVPSRVDGRRCS